MQDQLSSQGEKVSKNIVNFVAGHFTFLNPQTNYNAVNLLLQPLKLASEKLPLPQPDISGEMGINLSRPSATASNRMARKAMWAC